MVRYGAFIERTLNLRVETISFKCHFCQLAKNLSVPKVSVHKKKLNQKTSFRISARTWEMADDLYAGTPVQS